MKVGISTVQYIRKFDTNYRIRSNYFIYCNIPIV